MSHRWSPRLSAAPLSVSHSIACNHVYSDTPRAAQMRMNVDERASSAGAAVGDVGSDEEPISGEEDNASDSPRTQLIKANIDKVTPRAVGCSLGCRRTKPAALTARPAAREWCCHLLSLHQPLPCAASAPSRSINSVSVTVIGRLFRAGGVHPHSAVHQRAAAGCHRRQQPVWLPGRASGEPGPPRLRPSQGAFWEALKKSSQGRA